MIKVNKHLLFLGALLFLAFTLIYYATYVNLIVVGVANTRNTLIEYLHGKKHDVEFSSQTLFLYRAYLLNSTSIRVLSINRCVDPEWKLHGFVNGEQVTFSPRTIESSCPWGWAPGCLYNSYVFDALLKTDTTAESIILSRNGSDIRLPLHRIPFRTKGKLSVCVPPIYWFTDWTKLIFFLETWRAHGANHVFMYYHSSTEDVRRVLDHYQKEGFVTIISWPLLPHSSKINPNLSLYRLAHSLAHNDCVLRIDSEFGALVDIDELIVPRNGSLLSLVVQRFTSFPTVGALSFPHQNLLLDPPLAAKKFSFKALDFSGILNAKKDNSSGPPKVVFRTEAVDMLSTHEVRIFNSGFVGEQIPLTEAILLHNRYTNNSRKNCTAVKLFPSDAIAHEVQEAMMAKKTTIFPNGAEFHFEIQQLLGICLQNWRKTQHYCKTPILGCQDILLSLEDWYFTSGSDEFHAL
ncbi:hypothetical protein V3C99_014115 [Haemonchus contortus]